MFPHDTLMNLIKIGFTDAWSPFQLERTVIQVKEDVAILKFMSIFLRFSFSLKLLVMVQFVIIIKKNLCGKFKSLMNIQPFKSILTSALQYQSIDWTHL